MLGPGNRRDDARRLPEIPVPVPPLGPDHLPQQPAVPPLPSHLARSPLLHLRDPRLLALQLRLDLGPAFNLHASPRLLLLFFPQQRNRHNNPPILDPTFEARKDDPALPAAPARPRLLARLHSLRVRALGHEAVGFAHVLVRELGVVGAV